VNTSNPRAADDRWKHLEADNVTSSRLRSAGGMIAIRRWQFSYHRTTWLLLIGHFTGSP
jgi:hypothetical protein